MLFLQFKYRFVNTFYKGNYNNNKHNKKNTSIFLSFLYNVNAKGKRLKNSESLFLLLENIGVLFRQKKLFIFNIFDLFTSKLMQSVVFCFFLIGICRLSFGCVLVFFNDVLLLCGYLIHFVFLCCLDIQTYLKQAI